MVLILLCVISISSPAFVASPWAKGMTYGDKAWDKLLFGFKNLAFGWTEIFMEPKAAIDKGENVGVGIGKGLLYTIVDTLGGALHLLTAPIPSIDIPLPDDGVKY